MPALQVRDLPQEIYDQLAASAKRDHRSIAQQTTAILEHHFTVVEGGLSQRAQPTAAQSVSDFAPGVSFNKLMGSKMIDYDRLFRDPEFIKECRERRKRVLESIQAGPAIHIPEDMHPAKIIREMREERDHQIAVAIGLEQDDEEKEETCS